MEVRANWDAPHDPRSQTKEVELEQFSSRSPRSGTTFGRWNRRSNNASEAPTSAEKFDWQQYLTRIYGSLTTFNILVGWRRNPSSDAEDCAPARRLLNGGEVAVSGEDHC